MNLDFLLALIWVVLFSIGTPFAIWGIIEGVASLNRLWKEGINGAARISAWSVVREDAQSLIVYIVFLALGILNLTGITERDTDPGPFFAVRFAVAILVAFDLSSKAIFRRIEKHRIIAYHRNVVEELNLMKATLGFTTAETELNIVKEAERLRGDAEGYLRGILEEAEKAKVLLAKNEAEAAALLLIEKAEEVARKAGILKEKAETEAQRIRIEEPMKVKVVDDDPVKVIHVEKEGKE